METKHIIKHPTLLAIMAAIGCLLSFPPFNLYPLAFVSLVPLIISFKTCKTRKQAFLNGWIFGLIFMGGFHAWILTLAPWSSIGAILLLWGLYSSFLGLFYGLIGFLSVHQKKPLLFACIWVLVEFVKSISVIGNPAGSIGYSQSFNPMIAAFASIGGLFLVSFICVLINVLASNAWYSFTKKPSHILIVTFIGFHLIGWGLFLNTPTSTTTQTISLIQPNHTQKNKLNNKKWQALRNDYLRLIEKNLQLTKASTIILPETITPGLNTQQTAFINQLSRLAALYSTHIIFGTPTKTNNHFYNSAVMVTKKGLSKQVYHKNKLMPFGEYWPVKKGFKAIGLKNLIPGNEFSPGTTTTILTSHSAKIGTAICLESLYPWFFQKATDNGANLLITLVNNAWFFQSSAAAKHLQMTQFRAIEQNRYVLQAANTGISAIIANNGKIIQQTTLNKKEVLTKKIPLLTSKTIYTKTGNWIIILCCLLFLNCIIRV